MTVAEAGDATGVAASDDQIVLLGGPVQKLRIIEKLRPTSA